MYILPSTMATITLWIADSTSMPCHMVLNLHGIAVRILESTLHVIMKQCVCENHCDIADTESEDEIHVGYFSLFFAFALYFRRLVILHVASDITCSIVSGLV
jgi:hypothetical protein